MDAYTVTMYTMEERYLLGASTMTRFIVPLHPEAVNTASEDGDKGEASESSSS